MYKNRPVGRKVARLDDAACLDLGNSEEGSQTLRDPLASRFTAERNQRVNNHLTPRDRSHASHAPIRTEPTFGNSSGGFISARFVLDPTLALDTPLNSQQVSAEFSPHQKSLSPTKSPGRSYNIIVNGRSLKSVPSKRSKLPVQKNTLTNYFTSSSSSGLPRHLSDDVMSESAIGLYEHDIGSARLGDSNVKVDMPVTCTTSYQSNYNFCTEDNIIRSNLRATASSSSTVNDFVCNDSALPDDRNSASSYPKDCLSAMSGTNRYSSMSSNKSENRLTLSNNVCANYVTSNNSGQSSALAKKYHSATNRPVISTSSSNEPISHNGSSQSLTSESPIKDEFCSSRWQDGVTVMRSPIAKVPGTSTMYYSTSSPASISSQNGVWKPCNTASDLPFTSSVVKNLFCDDFEEDNRKWRIKRQASLDDDSLLNESIGEYCDTLSLMSSQKCVGKGKRGRFSKGKCPIAQRGSEDIKQELVNDDLKQQSDVCNKIEPTDSSGSNTYGPLGCSDADVMYISDTESIEEEEEVSHFSRLPVELVENILCRLPFVDLCLNVNLVCTAWNSIISSDRFMSWKKRYYRLLKDPEVTKAEMLKAMKEQSMTTRSLYLPQLIRMMKSYKREMNVSDMDASLRKHSNYQLAAELLKKHLPDCMVGDGKPHPWCMIVALVLVSERVSDIQQIIHCLLTGGSSLCTAADLLNCLYCIAAFLLVFKSFEYKELWTSMHYRLYYALYLYENESFSMSSHLANVFQGQKGQQSIRRYGEQASLRLTHEQMRICNHDILSGQVIRIVAFAGTGKTTTLVEYTRLRPSTKFLMVVFNKSVCEQAKKRFPSNVTCATSHSLAYKSEGWKYQKAGKIGSNIRTTDILEHATFPKGLSLYVQAKFIIDTLKNFMASADEFITTNHLPRSVAHGSRGNRRIHECDDHQLRMKLSEQAEVVWKKMANLEDKSIRLPHDGYLKLWQLRKPALKNFDVILIDEAQDLTPAVADIFHNQSLPRILVGDPHQQIYSFRGAVNAMQLIAATNTFYLTQSFRFGPEISYVAATILELYKNEKKKILVGNGIQDKVNGERVGQLAIITRTNFTLFAEAVNLCSFNSENFKIAFAGGLESFGLDMILDIYHLVTELSTEKKEECIVNPFIRRFIRQGFAELEKYAESAGDHELTGKIKIVKTYMHTLPSHVSRIQAKCVRDIALADIVLSTAHKAKGLEFDTVRVTDDFLQEIQNPIANQPNLKLLEMIPADEINLLYVAVTRAKKRLQMSKTLISLLTTAASFTYLVSPRSVVSEVTHKAPESSSNPVLSSKPDNLKQSSSSSVSPQTSDLCLVHRGINFFHISVTVDTEIEITKDTIIPSDVIRERYPSLAFLLDSQQPSTLPDSSTHNLDLDPNL